MKIILEHEDINNALVNYVALLGIDLLNKDIVVELTAGRKENGNSASIEITSRKPNNTFIVNEPKPEINEERSIQDDIDEGVPVEVIQEINDDDEIFS